MEREDQEKEERERGRKYQENNISRTEVEDIENI